MKLIFIRHGEPDYSIDSLTPKGWREAKLLARRTAGWRVTDYYCSPLGRAKDTASPTLKQAGREAVILPWLEEFNAPIINPDTGKRQIPWDLYPNYLDANSELFDPVRWTENSAFAAGKVGEHYTFVTGEFDALLASYGYQRHGLCYQALPNAKRDAVVVCFCHLGVTCVLLSHLMNVSPAVLWHSFFLPPTSVTVLGTEERRPGEVYFRCQKAGDTSHLSAAGEPVSQAGSFTEPFQEFIHP